MELLGCLHIGVIKASCKLCSPVVHIAYAASDSCLVAQDPPPAHDTEPAADHFELAIAIPSEVFATSALKASAALTRSASSAFVLVGYAMAYYFLSLALRTPPLAFAYATWACTGTILTILVSLMVFKQPLDVAALLGIALMVIGTLILNGFSRSGSH